MIKAVNKIKSSFLGQSSIIFWLGIFILAWLISYLTMFGLSTISATKNIIIFFCGLPVAAFFFVANNKVKFMIYLMVLIMPIATYAMPPRRFGLNIFDYCLIALVLMWLPNKILQDKKTFQFTPLTVPLLIIFGAAIFSSVFASESGLSFIVLAYNLKYFLFYIIFVDVIDAVRDLKSVVFCFSIGLFLSALMGIWQSFFGMNFTVYENLNANAGIVLSGIHFDRVVGPFANSLNFSNYMSVGILFLFYFIVRKRSKLVFIVVLIVISVISYSLILSLSRISVISAVICLGGGFFLVTKKYVFSIIIILIILLFMFDPQFYKDKIEKSGVYLSFKRIPSFHKISRVKLWKSAIPIFFAKPFTGSGLGNWDYGVSWGSISTPDDINFIFSSIRTFYYHFESMFFGVLYNLGLFALFGFLWLLYIVTSLNYRLFAKTDSYDVKASSLAIFLAWLSMIINMTTNPAVNSDIRVKLLFILLLAITVVNARLGRICNNKDFDIKTQVTEFK